MRIQESLVIVLSRVLISEEGATDLLRPMLPQIVAEYFRIMDEVENESVLSALQVRDNGIYLCRA